MPEFGAIGEVGGVEATVGGAEDDAVSKHDGRAFDAAAGLEGPRGFAGGAVDGVEMFVARANENEAVVNGRGAHEGQGAVFVGPGDFAADDVEGDGLIGVVAAERHGPEGTDRRGNLRIGLDFMDELAVLEVDDVELGVAAAEDEEAAIDDRGGAVDVVVGFVTPDEFAVGGGEDAGRAIVAVEENPVGAGCGGVGGGFDHDGSGANFVFAGELPCFLAGVGGERVEAAVVGGEKDLAGGDGGGGSDGILGGEFPELLAGVGGQAMEGALTGADVHPTADEGGFSGDRARGGEGPSDDRIARQGGGDVAAEGRAAAGHGPGDFGSGGFGWRFFGEVGS